MSFINKPTKTSREYKGGLNGIVINLHAESLYDAMEKTVHYFKPSKKNRSLVWVHLASEPVDTL